MAAETLPDLSRVKGISEAAWVFGGQTRLAPRRRQVIRDVM
jgi:hypothetical protein